MKSFRNIALLKIAVFIASGVPFTGIISAQELTVEKISVSTRIYDELSPVFFNDGIVFCTNRRTNSLIGYSNENARLFKLFYSKESSAGRWKSPVLFSVDITGTFNEGPATFNKDGTHIYFTRNNAKSGRFSNVNDTSEKLGIYSAELSNGIWQNIKPFAFNDPLFTYATPSLSSDGQRLYFSSDMPGGSGGMDIYYCVKCGNTWCDPVNAGAAINTDGNETYPFIDPNGKLWFASDGWPGLGGKDIFYTFEEHGVWKNPVSADSLINSTADDYGIIVDSTGLNGYFTSDRYSSEDIFRFSTILPEFVDCDTFSEPSYCFTIYDERYVPNDTLLLHYEWNFGNGIVKRGPQVKHCFPGPGNYKILLDITDEITGDTIAWQVEYPVTLDPPSQLFINAPNVGVAGKNITFNTNGSLLEGSGILDYSWDFGEGFKSGISLMEQKFQDHGKFMVSVGMKNEYGHSCISRAIRILKSPTEIIRAESGNHTLITLLSDIEVPSAIIDAFGKAGNGPRINIDQQGIHEETSIWLKSFLSLLKESRLHLEIQVYNKDNKLTAIQDSRELTYFLSNYYNDQVSFGVHAADLKQMLGEDFDSALYVYEFIITN